MVSLERVEDNRTTTQQEQKKKKKKSRDEYCSKAKAVRRTVASRFSSTARTCQFLPFEILRRIIPRNPFLEIFHLYDREIIVVGDDDRCEIPVNRGRGSTEEGDGILKTLCVGTKIPTSRAIRFIH